MATHRAGLSIGDVKGDAMTTPEVTNHPVIETTPLGFPWPVIDPFVVLVHHHDLYPPGNGALGPATNVGNLGDDRSTMGRGWHKYYGTDVPGFPAHPHRGFETVTYVRQGVVDHSDSFGATARYGHGDVQWLTAGRGIQHAEMFPLIETDGANTLELFQIWLNLPSQDKMTEPHFKMLWAEEIPHLVETDSDGNTAELTVIAGSLPGADAPAPPPASWGARQSADLAIWLVQLDPHAHFTLPAASDSKAQRMLYVFEADTLTIADVEVANDTAVLLRSDEPAPLVAGPGAVTALMLQAVPIDEPVVAHGPFVMNTSDEITAAFAEYRSSQFGGWPWPDAAPNHGSEAGRFARHPDGHVEEPAGASTAV